MANNYTKLKNNYMYGQKNRLNNYYQNYKNFSNDLDDPIFTGFTLSINMEQSPLFSGGSNFSYTSSIRNSGLTNEDKLSIDAQSLASQLEKSIKSKYDSRSENYEVTTEVIEKFDTNHKIGYGNQSNILSEGFSYNALEYIYMADRLVYGEKSSGSKSPATNIGGSSFSSSERGSISKKSSNSNNSSNSNDYNKSDEEKEKEAANIAAKESELENKEKEKSDALTDKLDAAKELLKKCKEDVEHNQKMINDIQNKINDLEELGGRILEFFNLLCGCRSLVKEYIDGKLGIGKVNNTIPAQSTNARNHFDDYYPEFKDKVSFSYGISFHNVGLVSIEQIKRQLTGDYGKDIPIEWLNTEMFKNILEVAYCNFDYDTEMNSNQNEVKFLNDDKNSLLVELYGRDSNGNICSESNPTEDSLYGKYKSAEDELKNLMNSPEVIACEELKNELDELTNNDSNQNESSPVQNNNYTPGGQQENMSIVENDMEFNSSSNVYIAPQSCVDLAGFINGMKKLTEANPYIFQTVSGLDEAYKSYFKVSDPYQGSGENKITINCYESVDMRVSSMFNKYFNAIYDKEYKRERLPINLRRFKCSIFVHDIRNFRHALNLLFKNGQFNEDGDNPQNLITEVALNHLSAVEFKFSDCEIIPEETGNIFETINNAELGEQRMTTFSFRYGNCFINFLPFADLVTYYKTSGANNDLGNEKNITKATRKIAENGKYEINGEVSEQITEFREEEEKIISGNTSIKPTDTPMNSDDIIADSKHLIIDDNIEKIYDYTDYYDVEEQDADINKRHLIIGDNVRMTDDYVDFFEVAQQGRDRYLTEYDTEYNFYEDYHTAKDDYFKRMDAEDISRLNSDSLYMQNRRALDITMRSLSASTGIPTKDIYKRLGLGNVYRHDNIEPTGDVTELNNVYRFDNTDNDGLNKTNGNVYKKDNSNHPLSTSDENVYTQNTNGGKNISNIGNQYISNPGQTVTSDLINNEFGNIDKKLFGDGAMKGINDKVNGTSITDYIPGSNDQIGVIKEETIIDTSFLDNNEGEIAKDSINVSKIYPSQPKISDDDIVHEIGDVISDKEMLSSGNVDELGNLYSKIETPEIVNEIDKQEPKEEDLQYAKNIGKINGNTSSNGLYKNSETVYSKTGNIENVPSIGVINQHVEPGKDYKDLGLIENNINQTPDVTSIESKIDEIKSKGDYTSEKLNYDIGDTSNVDSIGNVNTTDINSKNIESIGNVNTNKDEIIGEYISEKRNIEIDEGIIVKKIGNVYNTPSYQINTAEFDDLNDLQFK